MKRKLLLAFVASTIILSGIIVFVNSCKKDSTSDCKQCQMHIYTGSKDSSIGSSQQYCGSDLELKENATPITVGDQTSKWVCK